jgi:serine/threonine protein kinase
LFKNIPIKERMKLVNGASASGKGQTHGSAGRSIASQAPDVAIKVLPAAFADDPGWMARFQREAQVLASLNHPGIAAI